MAEIRKFVLGPDAPPPSEDDIQRRIEVLTATVEHYLPEFVKAVNSIVESGEKNLVLHQDAFAAGYDDDEFTLLGLAVKYAGLKGVHITVICGDGRI